MRSLSSAALVLLVLGVASQASAGDKIWHVPGVINNGLATVISCTNGGNASATVTVDVFHQDGTLSGTGNNSVPAGQSRIFTTQAVASLLGETNLGSGDVRGGNARITAPSGVFCAAYIVDPFGDPPSVMSSLPIIKKTSQKGD